MVESETQLFPKNYPTKEQPRLQAPTPSPSKTLQCYTLQPHSMLISLGLSLPRFLSTPPAISSPVRHVIQFQTPSQMNPETPFPTSEYNATSTLSLPKITVSVWRAEVCFWCRTQLSCATGSGPSWPY